jgi:hypothetical protein
MKNIISIFLIAILTITVSNANQNSEKTVLTNEKNNENNADSSLLDFYRQYSSFTNPGKYGDKVKLS